MAFTLDPADLIGNQLQSAIGAPIIIGLPSPQAPIPNFVIGVTPEENVNTSISLPGFQITSGDLFLKSAINPGQFSFSLVLSQDPLLSSEWLPMVTAAIQGLTALANSFANFGSVLPNLSGVSSNYAIAQLATLHAIKNGTQPVMLLNSFTTLASISQNNAFLSSEWYIESIQGDKQEAEGGMTVIVTLKEILKKRDVSLGGLLKNLANELLSPAAGSSLGSLL